MKFLREPLVQFLLIGAVLFGLGYARKGGDSRHDIVVSAGKIAQLTQQFQAVWTRPPTRQELEGLIESYVREEVFYREAVAMGLDQDDQVIRRRLMTKLQFVTEDQLTQAEPSDSELAAWLAANPDKVRRDPLFTFSQRYAANQRGDRTVLDHDFTRIERRDVALKFGDEFAAALDSAPVGRWSGPVRSGYGLHMVLVRERTPGSVPPLAEVRSQVVRELQNQRRERGLDSLYKQMKGNYHVSVVWPTSSTDSSGAAR